MRHTLSLVACFLFLISLGVGTTTPKPVYIGLDAEFGITDSTSAQAIERGILIAIDEINRAGGVLNGRPLVLQCKDNHSVTARGIQNLKDFAKVPDLVAMFVGRFSPVVLEYIELAHDLQMIILDPWAAADAITNNGFSPNYAFRLSLQDSLAMPVMFYHAAEKGAQRVGLLLPTTSWGRSNLTAAERYLTETPLPRVVATAWYDRGDSSMLDKYEKLRNAGAEAVLFVANDSEAVILAKEVAALPKEQRLPIVSHWGVTGGNFFSLVGDDLSKIDYSVVQTFSFFKADSAMVERVMTVAKHLFPDVTTIADIASPVGVGHAYDLTHLLARAIELAETTERTAIRDALEKVKNYRGLVKFYRHPFSPNDHDALGANDVFMATYRADGAIVPLRHQ